MRAPRFRTGLFLSGALLLVSGCGGESAAPVESVPQLGHDLTRVETAIADHAYTRARARLDRLVETTIAARDSGDLDTEQADRVLAAAARLMSALPKPARTSQDRTPPEPAPEHQGTGEEDREGHEEQAEERAKKREEEREKLEEQREKKAEERAKKLEEQQKKLEKQQEDDGGGGHGHSNGNGPDDGKGN